MVWLVGRRWWLLAGAFVVLLLGVLRSISVLSIIPVVLVLFLLFFSILMALLGRRETPRRPGPH